MIDIFAPENLFTQFYIPNFGIYLRSPMMNQLFFILKLSE